MSSISRILPSAFTAIADISPALANFNFDFTMVKVAAPVEFNGVGDALSGTRRTEAESGQIHVTARRLGALFARVLPKTPTLISLYGSRASEIAQISLGEAKSNHDYGFFAERVGPDGTTIWAAATSGPGAIAVHLLACLLARIWDRSEAISIWVEIVRQRREEILKSFDETNMALETRQPKLPPFPPFPFLPSSNLAITSF